MSDVYKFGVDPISCHSWNKDRTQIAISQNSNDVQLHRLAGGKWSLTDTLSEHGQRVTGIDWAPNSNQIVTCAVDRNAYVWNLGTDKKWKPTLVVLRLNRAATFIRWSPMENKFAVGTGAKLVAICYFDNDNNWWTSKHIKKSIRSTVTCLDWHSNNILIACGSTDFKARVFSGFVKEVDEKPNSTSWGSKMPFGNLMAEFTNVGGGWIHSICFSDNGERVAWVSHDSTISVVDASNSQKMAVIRTDMLPFTSVLWTNDSQLIVAGFDCVPVVYRYDGSNVNFVSNLDGSDEKQQQTGRVSAMAKFKNLDSKSQQTSETSLNSKHQNTISQMSIHSGTKAKCSKLATSGLDGQLIVWTVKM